MLKLFTFTFNAPFYASTLEFIKSCNQIRHLYLSRDQPRKGRGDGRQSLAGEQALSGASASLPPGNWGYAKVGAAGVMGKQGLCSSRTMLQYDGKNPGEEIKRPVIWPQFHMI